MSKESDRKEINRILHRMVASPFRAILGDGGGTVNVTGKIGYVWARKLGQEEKVFQAYNRGISATNEGRVVLVQESRVEGLPGYEVIGSAGGDYTDLSGHIATEPFDAHARNPTATARRTTDQSIPDSAWTSVIFDTEVADTGAIWEGVTNPTRFTCKTAGTYLMSGWVHWAQDADGRRGTTVYLNNTTQIGRGDDTAIGAAVFTANNIVCQYALAINDYVEFKVYQNSGGALNVVDPWAIFTMTRVA